MEHSQILRDYAIERMKSAKFMSLFVSLQTDLKTMIENKQTIIYRQAAISRVPNAKDRL